MLHGETSNDFVRDTGTALAVNWTDGTPDAKPHANGTATNTGVKSRTPAVSDFYQMNVTGSPSAARVLSFYLSWSTPM